jgi:nicotinic acid mononucleotide adenylyltransferase
MREISSTQVRQRISLGQDIADLVDADVEQYIHRNELYKENATAKESSF